MTLPTGCKTRDGNRVAGGFTLIELVAVMILLAVVFAVSAPSLSRFFQGRSLDAEARRMLSLTRWAKSEAASRGLPQVLWIDREQHLYGLETKTGFPRAEQKTFRYELARHLEIEFAQANLARGTTTPAIEFLPDGTLGPESILEWRVRDHRSDNYLAIVVGLNGRDFEILSQDEYQNWSSRR